MNIKCKVKSVSEIADDTYKVCLMPEEPVPFKAGQYLLVVMDEVDKRPFSIANSPDRDNGELELHIGCAEGNSYAQEVVDKLMQSKEKDSLVSIDCPHGEAWYRSTDKPVLLIAGGTGFSYVRSIVEHCVLEQVSVPIHLYWGGRTELHLYAMEEMVQLAEKYNNLEFIPVVETPAKGWTGKVGNVLQAVNDDFEDLSAYNIYIAGRFEMAGAAREQFVTEKNANLEQMFADAYAFI